MPLRPGWQRQAEQTGRQLAQGSGGDLGSPRRPRASPAGQADYSGQPEMAPKFPFSRAC